MDVGSVQLQSDHLKSVYIIHIVPFRKIRRHTYCLTKTCKKTACKSIHLLFPHEGNFSCLQYATLQSVLELSLLDHSHVLLVPAAHTT
jgi:hypothetical protein